MNYVRKTYVSFRYPGLFFDEGSARQVKTRDASKLKVPKDAYAFSFFDIVSAIVDVDGKKVELTSSPINVSPMHYYGGKIYTVAELKREFPSNKALIGNIQDSGHKKAICCRTGNWQPFTETDVFIKAA